MLGLPSARAMLECENSILEQIPLQETWLHWRDVESSTTFVKGVVGGGAAGLNENVFCWTPSLLLWHGRLRLGVTYLFSFFFYLDEAI